MDYEKLIEQVERGRIEKERLMERIAQLERVEERLQEVAVEYELLLSGDFGEDDQTPEPSPTGVILDAAARVLTGQAEPVLAGEILARLESAGVRVGGVNPSSNLSAKLSNAKDRFQSHGRGKGWTLLPDSRDEFENLDQTEPEQRTVRGPYDDDDIRF